VPQQNAQTNSPHLVHAFDERVATTPAKAALVTDTRTTTFAEIAERSQRLAEHLRDAGIGRGDRVMVVLPNSAEFVITMLAIWRAGAIAVPVHVKSRTTELDKYVAECRIRAVVGTAEFGGLAAELVQRTDGMACAVLFGRDDEPWTQIAGRTSKSQETEPWNDEDPPALTQFSTGSTGVPKRVTRTHEQVLAEARTVARLFAASADDRILAVAPFFHAFGFVHGMLRGLVTGATLYAPRQFFARDLARLIERERITFFPGVPFLHQMLAEFQDRIDGTSLRHVISAGAPLLPETTTLFRANVGVPILSLYGTTETGAICVDLDEPSGSVGLPIDGVSVTIHGEDGETLERGREGRVRVHSAYAAQAYDTIVQSAESAFDGGGFFPGDLGYLRDDGKLVLTGRKRRFINVAGNKVDPTELEDVLRQHPAVADAAVVALSTPTEGERIKAVLVASAPVTRAEILGFCRSRLADHKAPAVIEFMTELPRSPTGKVLRKYLLDPNP
jgi:long-chain acyl-CoA synthetase